MINQIYKNLLKEVLEHGDVVNTRNHETYSNVVTSTVILNKFPLVTARKTAWKKAIREMEWFLSGDEKCPNELLDWWNNQLNKDGCLLYGYSKQFRHYVDPSNPEYTGNYYATFDQVGFILNSLKTNPYSRRLLMTSWHSGEMSRITSFNDNKNTPTSCHSIIVQFFVRNNQLHLYSYQRSADMLLGVPHNWVQSWAMLLFFAYHSNLTPGSIRWCFGDAHIYKEESHLEVANSIISNDLIESDVNLIYEPLDLKYDDFGIPIFNAEDFYITGEIPQPIINKRPKLL